MNDFHLFSIYLSQKNKIQAMLILRDKSEFAARKIMEKAYIRVPACTGRIFWNWVQSYIYTACRSEQENTFEGTVNHSQNSFQSTAANDTAESRSSGFGETPGDAGHAPRSLQHAVSEPAAAGTVCARQSGLPVVQSDLGHQRKQEAGTSAVSGKPVMAVGSSNPAGIHAGISPTRSVVRAEYSLRICRHNTTPGLAPTVRNLWPRRRYSSAGGTCLAIVAGKLWSAGRNSDGGAGCNRRQRISAGSVLCRLGSFPVAGNPQRRLTSCHHACGDTCVCHVTDVSFSLDGRDCRTAAHGGQTPALASGPVLLSGLCGASPARRNDSVFCLNRRGLPVLYRPDKPLKRRSDAKR
ncbi:FIG00554578: hypothetical protein [Cronobacter malonaticus 681]|nr:FIG00554578: hypothetical protein [Cronobacter malonaticus 681]